MFPYKGRIFKLAEDFSFTLYKGMGEDCRYFLDSLTLLTYDTPGTCEKGVHLLQKGTILQILKCDTKQSMPGVLCKINALPDKQKIKRSYPYQDKVWDRITQKFVPDGEPYNRTTSIYRVWISAADYDKMEVVK